MNRPPIQDDDCRPTCACGGLSANTCGNCGHHVNVHCSPHPHRCDLTGSRTAYPDTAACSNWIAAGNTRRIHVPHKGGAR